MLSNDSRPGAPTSESGSSTILYVPGFVQRFSAQRRILARLRALASRRSRATSEPEVALEPGPVTLQVEENPHWSPAEDRLLEGLGTGLREWRTERGGGKEPLAEVPDLLAELSSLTVSASAEPPPPPVESPREEVSAAIIRQLEEDNQDLKAALCRLIRISEQNHAALRLLEEENEELSTLAHRLTIGQVAGGLPPVEARRPWWQVGAWVQRRQAERCR
jgi:hypothetical protein